MIAPADGKIIAVRTLDPAEHEGYRYFVSIFMNVFDVHVNRAPLGGTISAYTYHPGKFKVAFDEAASLENEHNMVTIAGERCRLRFSQVAGLLARRIVFWKKEGDRLNPGERVGLICFGSRVDVWLPPEVAPVVRMGQRVKASGTFLARFTDGR